MVSSRSANRPVLHREWLLCDQRSSLGSKHRSLDSSFEMGQKYLQGWRSNYCRYKESKARQLDNDGRQRRLLSASSWCWRDHRSNLRQCSQQVIYLGWKELMLQIRWWWDWIRSKIQALHYNKNAKSPLHAWNFFEGCYRKLHSQRIGAWRVVRWHCSQQRQQTIGEEQEWSHRENCKQQIVDQRSRGQDFENALRVQR